MPFTLYFVFHLQDAWDDDDDADDKKAEETNGGSIQILTWSCHYANNQIVFTVLCKQVTIYLNVKLFILVVMY